MIDIRYSDDRGPADHGWLQSRHTFSFGSYYDPEHMGVSALRVINDDKVTPGAGFATHSHQDMEIISYVKNGTIEHKDSMGNGTLIHAGELQRMTAGTGVLHSEFNPSDDEELHLLQIWVLPEKDGLEPGYEQARFAREDKLNQLKLIVSRDARDGSLAIHQDVDLYASLLRANDSVSYELGEDRNGWVQVARGSVRLDDNELSAGDGVALKGARTLTFEGVDDAEILLFDMGQ